MQRCTILFIIVDAVHVPGGFPPSSGAQELYIQHLARARLARTSPTTLAVAAASLPRNKCCVYSSWAPDDGRRNRPKHVEHRQY
jgi:3-deoxy-D-manno-octulosonic acid (KDO) 8-phosphate synthase